MTTTGLLFQDDAKKRFIEITGQRFDALAVRLKKKGLPPMDFTKDDLRDHVLKALGGKYDGFVQCVYCRGFFTLADVAFDHERPLAKGGGSGIDNIGFPCAACNARKGKMTPKEYLDLLEFLETKLPLARTDVLERLEKAVSLARGFTSNAAVINELKKSGDWQRAQKVRRDNKKAKESGLGKF